jgi:hypothetical protein
MNIGVFMAFDGPLFHNYHNDSVHKWDNVCQRSSLSPIPLLGTSTGIRGCCGFDFSEPGFATLPTRADL